jgi:hypothetical protein
VGRLIVGDRRRTDPAAYWYAGSSEPGLTYGNNVGRLWSPLLPGNTGTGNPPQSLAPSYEQSWNLFNYAQNNQFDLNTFTPSAFNPIFNPVMLPATQNGGVVVTNPASGASVQLTQTGGTMQTYTASFTTAESHPIRGMTFQYQFQNAAPGDELTINIDGDLSFAMVADLVGSQTEPGTISVGDVFGGESHTVSITLTSVQPNSTSGVIVSNIQQFADE